MTMNTVDLTDDVAWISHCHEEDDRHTHLSQYVLRGEGNVLIDAGAGDEHEMKEAIRAATDDGTVDALLLTHSVLPHTQNVDSVQAEWEGVDVISASPVAEIVGLHDARPKVLNATEEVAGRTFSFLDPLMTDAVVSNWIYDHDAKVLFTAEGIGHYHSPGDCTKTSAEMDGGVPYEHVHAFHRDKLPYLECLDPEKLRAGFEAVREEFDIEWIAPMHGNPVAREDLDGYLDTVMRSVDAFKPVA